MRVIGGIYRSRVLNAPEGLNTRPTMDNVKEAMFNIIGPFIQGSICLDLFSGSGGLGIESLSRGAKFVYFNDFDKNAFNCIKNNIESLKIEQSKYKLSMLDYKDCIDNIESSIDILFLDPPYKEKIYEDIIHTLVKKNKFSNYAVIVCECDLNQNEFSLEGFKSKEYRYGKKKLIIYKKTL